MIVIIPPEKSPLMRARHPLPVFRVKEPMERGRPARNASRRLAYRRIFHHRTFIALIS
jgi:hypothetical protein